MQQEFVKRLLQSDPSKRPSASEALETVRENLTDGNPRKDKELSFDRVRTVPQGYREKKQPKSDSKVKVTAPGREKVAKPAQEAKRTRPGLMPQTVIINRGGRASTAEAKPSPTRRVFLTLLLLLIPIIGPATRFFFLERENREDYPSRVERLLSAAFFSYYTLGIGGFIACRKWAKASSSRRLAILGWLQLLWLPLSVGPVALTQVMPNTGAAISLAVFLIYLFGPILQSLWAPDWSSKQD